MKYEFHVGDYVETKDGEVGYVANAAYTKIKNGCLFMDVDVFYDIAIVYYKTKDIVGEFHGKQSSIPDYFNRIGQYDFTKKDDSKIEPSTCETASDYSNEKLRKKINELVEAVNQLKEKVNEMA
jgi:hypothetical protein